MSMFFQMQRTTVLQSTPSTVESMVQQEDTANDKAIWVVFRKMLFFTVMMTVAPLTSFYISKDFIFEGMFGMDNSKSYIYSAGVAVIIVHIILFAFLYVAFRDDRSPKSKAEQIKESAGKRD